MVNNDYDFLIRNLWVTLKTEVYYDVSEYLCCHPLLDQTDYDHVQILCHKLHESVMKFLHKKIDKILEEELSYERKR